MAVHNLLLPPRGSTYGDVGARMRRWRYFRLIFGALYLGIVLDIVTTAVGFRKDGSAYEQNPLGSLLIDHLGWIGLFFILTAICVVCFLSLRIVFWRMGKGWSLGINAVLTALALLRWLIVFLTVQYLLHAP